MCGGDEKSINFSVNLIWNYYSLKNLHEVENFIRFFFFGWGRGGEISLSGLKLLILNICQRLDYPEISVKISLEYTEFTSWAYFLFGGGGNLFGLP